MKKTSNIKDSRINVLGQNLNTLLVLSINQNLNSPYILHV